MHERCIKTLLIYCIIIAVGFNGSLAGKLEKTRRIVGGSLTTIDKVPYVVQLRDITGRFFCGGSLIADKIVITAAHCLDTTEQKHIVVVGGATYTDETGVQSKIAQKFVHPSYVRASFTHDIAVLKLVNRIEGKNIQTIPLCSGYVKPGEVITISGWGYTSETKSEVSHQVRTARVPTFAFEKCREMYSVDEIKETMMCASDPGVKDACTTDSGGPAVRGKELCGVVSWGTGCGRAEYPGVYTNITTIRSFIDKCLNE